MICKNCSEIISGTGRTCGVCGTWNAQAQSSNALVNLQYLYTSQPAEYERIDFLAKLKQLTRSFAFILGCLLITVSTVGGIFLDFSWQSILGLAFSAIYIVALWLLVLDAFSPTAHKKTLTALSMLRVSFILSMILACVVFGVMSIVALFSIALFFLFFLAIVGGFVYLMVKYYFLAFLKVLDSIRERMTTGRYCSLEGLGSFLVLNYIGIVLYAVIAFVDMAVGLGEAAATSFAFPWGVMFAVTHGAGLLLCLRTLKRFE